MINFNQLYDYVSHNNLLTNYQSGFRALHSTVTSLLNFIDKWRFSNDKGQINGVVFVDLKKAFDTVDHSILLSKMKRYGLNKLTLRYFRSYLENRCQSRFVNDHLSHKLPVNCGVPQDLTLGPLLFFIFINDLPNCFNTGTAAMYADDTIVTFNAVDTANLQSQMNTELVNLDNWLIANKLSLTVSKTEFMLVTTRQKLAFIDDALNIII